MDTTHNTQPAEDAEQDGGGDICCLSWCNQPYYATYRDGDTALRLCQHDFDRVAR